MSVLHVHVAVDFHIGTYRRHNKALRSESWDPTAAYLVNSQSIDLLLSVQVK